MPTVPTVATARGDQAALREAAGDGYAGEWGLFCTYTAATDQPTLPTTLAALTGFLHAMPARPSTLARRVRAIAAAHRRAGHLLDRPARGPAAPPGGRARSRPDPALMIAACPTRGWPDGLWGRRDGFLVVLVDVLELGPPQVRDLRPGDINIGQTSDDPDDPDDPEEGSVPCVSGKPVAGSDDARTCPRCAVLRWLDVLGVADGIGRGSARMDLTTAHAPTPTTRHRHIPLRPDRWQRPATVLLPAIDRHGTHDHHRAMSLRTIRARLALAAARAHGADPLDDPARNPPTPAPLDAPTPRTAARTALELDDVLSALDDIADDADALNARIQALLEDPPPRR